MDPKSTPFPLLKLHPELILCIFDCLDTIDAICLAISNKFLYSLVPKDLDFWLFFPSQTEDLLTRLERDLVDTHVYCFGCEKLESYTARSLRTGMPLPTNQNGSLLYCRSWGFRYSNDWWRGGLDFGYHLVRFILNQYHLRQEPGDITVDAFRGDPRRTKPRNEMIGPGYWDVSVRAKMIDMELYLHVTHTAKIANGTHHQSGYTLFTYRDWVGSHHVCTHQTAFNTFEDHHLQATNQGMATDMYLRTATSCLVCLSDFTYQRRLEGVHNIITIQGFHALGNLADFSIIPGWKFDSFVHERRHIHHDGLDKLTRVPLGEALSGERYPPGSIREAWLSAEC